MMDYLGPILKSGEYYISSASKKIENIISGIETNTMWVHAKLHPEHLCERDHRLIFAMYHQLPPHCMECYKVCVSPPTLKDLLYVQEQQIASGLYCKCGCEMRDYIPRNYGAYFYCMGLEEGKERLNQVKGMFPDFDVCLKRGCTEFEVQFGPSDKWEITKEALDVEAWLNEHVNFTKNTEQPDYLKEYIQSTWIAFANIQGDYSCGEYRGQLHQNIIKEAGRKFRAIVETVKYG